MLSTFVESRCWGRLIPPLSQHLLDISFVLEILKPFEHGMVSTSLNMTQQCWENVETVWSGFGGQYCKIRTAQGTNQNAPFHHGPVCHIINSFICFSLYTSFYILNYTCQTFSTCTLILRSYSVKRVSCYFYLDLENVNLLHVVVLHLRVRLSSCYRLSFSYSA